MTKAEIAEELTLEAWAILRVMERREMPRCTNWFWRCKLDAEQEEQER